MNRSLVSDVQFEGGESAFDAWRLDRGDCLLDRWEGSAAENYVVVLRGAGDDFSRGKAYTGVGA